jgi:hypothetical protein
MAGLIDAVVPATARFLPRLVAFTRWMYALRQRFTFCGLAAFHARCLRALHSRQ